ncbi:MAG: hypothetical protein AAF799_20555 [Myxococcota bacterium]
MGKHDIGRGVFLRQLAGFASLASVAPTVIGCGDDEGSDTTDGGGTGTTTTTEPGSSGNGGGGESGTTAGAGGSSSGGAPGTTTGEDGSTGSAEDTTAGSDEGAQACPNEVVASIVSDPEHSLVIPPADIEAGVEQSYDIQGIAGHPHTVVVTAAHFEQLRAGKSVTLTSSVDANHDHDDVVLMC